MHIPIVFAAAVEVGVIFDLFLMIVFAKLLAEIFERLRQPAVVGEILAGILIGPSLLGWVQPSEVIGVLAEIGVIFLLFMVGLETKPQAILKVGMKAAIVAVLGVIIPFAAGYLIMFLTGRSNIEAMFLGAALVATSVGITARVLSGMNLLDAETARIILGAAVIDDILGLLILAVVKSISTTGVNYLSLAVTAGLAIGFTVLVAGLIAPFLTRIAPKIQRLRIGDSLFIFGLILCLGLSVAAAYIGVAAIIGAFLAGMALAESAEDNHEMHRQTRGLTEFLVPFFLVNIGMQLKLEIFRDASVIVLALVVTLAAVVTKLVGCGLAALDLGWRRAGQIGMGMVPRGEVGVVVAQIGLTLVTVEGTRAIDDNLFGVILFMAVATTLIAPPFIKMLFAGEDAADNKIDTDDAGGSLPERLSPLG
ncbi:MAG TPA: cation:proton antiporter [Pyrinomonadaceae bacterium]|jgi:Kef-type K+ transport system membrane component KefB